MAVDAMDAEDVPKRKRTAGAGKPTVRSEFEITSKMKPFYTGGRISVCRSKKLAACACGEEVNIVSLESGKTVQTIPGDGATASSVCLSENGRDLFVASRSLQTSHWDLESTTCVRRFKGHKAPIAHMCTDSQNLYLCTAGADGMVKVWDVQKGFITHSFKGHQGVVLFSVFHPYPKKYQLYTCGDDTTIRVWDLRTKKCLSTLKAHLSTATSLSVSPCGDFLLSCGQDSMAHIWGLTKFAKVSSIPLNEVTNSAVFLSAQRKTAAVADGVAASGDGKPSSYFVTVGQSGRVKFWNPRKFLCEHEIAVDDTCEKEGGCLDFAVVDGTTVVCTTLDCRILIYALSEDVDRVSRDLQTKKPASFWSRLVKESEQLVGNNEQITDVRFLDLRHLVVATNSQYIRIYDAETFACLSSLSGHTDIVLTLSAHQVSSDRFLIASGGKDNTLLVWESNLKDDGVCLGRAEGHFSAIETVALSNAQGAAKVADLVCSGDGDGFIKMWDLGWIAKDEERPPGGATTSMKTLSTAAAHDKDVNAVAFSPDNGLICTGSQDKTAKLWSVPALAPVRTFRGHTRGVWTVSFSPGKALFPIIRLLSPRIGSLTDFFFAPFSIRFFSPISQWIRSCARVPGTRRCVCGRLGTARACGASRDTPPASSSPLSCPSERKLRALGRTA